MSAALRKGWCPGALQPMATKDGLLVRLRPTGGILPAAAAHAVADLAERYGNSRFDLTARANLQMRGVHEASLPALQDGLQTLGLLDATADAEAVRNVIASPLAGLHDGPDIRPLVYALEKRLAGDIALHALPGKFGFLVDDGSWPTLAGVEADVRFDWDGARFAVSLGGTRDEAVQVGGCAATALVDCAGTIAERALALLARRPGARRMRHLVGAFGPEGLAREFGRDPSPACGRRWPDKVGSDEGIPGLDFDDKSGGEPPHPTPSNDGAAFFRRREKGLAREIVGLRRLGANAPLPLAGRGEGWGSWCSSRPILKDGMTPTPCPSPHGGGEMRRHRGLSFIGIAAPFGRLDAAMLRNAAALAEQSPFAELRLTPWRTILIPGIEGLDTPLPGFIIEPGDPRLTVAACVGVEGCAQGTTDTQADAALLAEALTPGTGIDLHVSGCEKGCAKASPSSLTLVARDGRYDLVRNGSASDPPLRRGLDLAAARAAIADAMQPA